MLRDRKPDGLRELRRRREAARRRVAQETPFSPAWDAAMAELEDVERDLWRHGEHGEDARTAYP